MQDIQWKNNYPPQYKVRIYLPGCVGVTCGQLTVNDEVLFKCYNRDDVRYPLTIKVLR